MNLAYRLTETVEIDGTTHPIDLSFDNVLRLIDMLNDKDLNDETQIEIGLYMLLGVNLDMKIETKEEVFYKNSSRNTSRRCRRQWARRH